VAGGSQLPGIWSQHDSGIGIPIPILDEEILQYIRRVRDEDIFAPIVDYSEDILTGNQWIWDR
jgi:uncharacterized protein (DUF39 family)